MNRNAGVGRFAWGRTQQGGRNKIWSSAVVVAGLVLTLGGALSWGGPPPPPNNDVSDDNENTAGGTGALLGDFREK